MVFLGLEAEEIDALTEVNKHLNLKRGIDSYTKAFRRIQQAGISVLGAFIFGMDSDTPERLRQRARYMMRSRINVMQTTILTPLPGTRLFKRYQKEGRLLYTDFPDDWIHYDMTGVIHQPRNMTPNELATLNVSLNKQMYARGVLACKAIGALWRTRDMTATMFAWNSNMNYRNVAKSRRKIKAIIK